MTLGYAGLLAEAPRGGGAGADRGDGARFRRPSSARRGSAASPRSSGRSAAAGRARPRRPRDRAGAPRRVRPGLARSSQRPVLARRLRTSSARGRRRGAAARPGVSRRRRPRRDARRPVLHRPHVRGRRRGRRRRRSPAGGRYDRLLARFGARAPALGFCDRARGARDGARSGAAEASARASAPDRRREGPAPAEDARGAARGRASTSRSRTAGGSSSPTARRGVRASPPEGRRRPDVRRARRRRPRSRRKRPRRGVGRGGLLAGRAAVRRVPPLAHRPGGRAVPAERPSGPRRDEVPAARGALLRRAEDRPRDRSARGLGRAGGGPAADGRRRRPDRDGLDDRGERPRGDRDDRDEPRDAHRRPGARSSRGASEIAAFVATAPRDGGGAMLRIVDATTPAGRRELEALLASRRAAPDFATLREALPIVEESSSKGRSRRFASS